MPVPSQCPGCGRKGTVPDRLAGARLKCPGCGRTFVAPELPTADRDMVDLYDLEGDPEPVEAAPPPAVPAAKKAKTKVRPAGGGSRNDLRVKGALMGLGLALLGVVGANVVKPLPKNPVTPQQKGEVAGAMTAYLLLVIATPVVMSKVYHDRHA